MARKNRLISKIANSVTEDGTFSNEVLAADFSVRVDVYDSINALPIPVPQLGTQAFVPTAKRFYLSDGNGWYSVSAVNSTPVIQSITDSDGNIGPFALDKFGDITTLTITVLDSDADPLSYSATTSSEFDGMGTLNQINNSNVFQITPFSSDSATYESGTITFTATDDVNIASSLQNFTLIFFTGLENPLTATYTSYTILNVRFASVGAHRKTNKIYHGDWNNAQALYITDASNTLGNNTAPTYVTAVNPGNSGAIVHYLEYKDWIIASGWSGVLAFVNATTNVRDFYTSSFGNNAAFARSLTEFAEARDQIVFGEARYLSLLSVDTPLGLTRIGNRVSNSSNQDMRVIGWDARSQRIVTMQIDRISLWSVDDTSGAPFTEVAGGTIAGGSYPAHVDTTFRHAWMSNGTNLYYWTWDGNDNISAQNSFDLTGTQAGSAGIKAVYAEDGYIFVLTAQTNPNLEYWNYRDGNYTFVKRIQLSNGNNAVIGTNGSFMAINDGCMFITPGWNLYNTLGYVR